MKHKLERQICYAAMAADGIRAESSSGGAFTILARNILARGGAICGAAFDEGFLCGLLEVDARLVFSCRLTEGAPCCRACYE